MPRYTNGKIHGREIWDKEQVSDEKYCSSEMSPRQEFAVRQYERSAEFLSNKMQMIYDGLGGYEDVPNIPFKSCEKRLHDFRVRTCLFALVRPILDSVEFVTDILKD